MRKLRSSEPLLDLAAVAALLVLVLVFNPDLVFRGMVLGGYDTFVYFYPLRAYFAQSLAEGRLPLWNPHLFLGVPFLANPQTAVLYPGTLLFAVLDTPSAYVVNFLGHLFIAGGSLYAFARWSLGLTRLGSLLAGSAFAFSGFLAGQAGHLNQVSVAAWLPGVAFALDVVLRRGYLWAAVLMVAGLVMQLLAGHPQEVYMTLVVLAVLVLWRCWGEGPRSLARGATVLAVLTGLAFGIAAVQLVPSVELARLSIRGAGLDYEQAIVDSLPWQLLLPALLPGFWAHLSTTEFFGHIGTIFLVLAWLGLSAGAGRPAVLGGLLVMLGLGLAVGNANPLYRVLFDWAPAFGSFRVPARWLLVYTFGACLLVAVGTSWLEQACRGRRRVPSRGRLLVVGLGIPLVALAIAFLGQRQSRLLLLVWVTLGALALGLAGLALLAPRLRVAALTLLAIGGLGELWLASAGLEHRHPIPKLAYAQPRESTAYLQSLDGLGGQYRMLSIATAEYEVKESPEYRERFDWLHPEALKNLLVAVKWNETLTPNVPLQYRFNSADGYDGGVLPLAAFVKLTGALLQEKVRPDGVLASRLDYLPERGWLDLLAIRSVLAGRAKDLTHEGLYYDRAVSVTLRPGERLELTSLPLGEFTRLGMISSFRGPSRAGQEVARLELSDPVNAPSSVALLDQTHTAAANVPPFGLPSLEAVQGWSVTSEDELTDWIAQIHFARRPVARLQIVNSSPDLLLDIRSLNLVDDARRASFSLTLDDTLERTEFFDMKVYDRADALPRAYITGRADVVDDESALALLADGRFDPRGRVLLAPMEGAHSLRGTGAAQASAVFELNGPERVRIRAATDAPSYLVLSDSWYPGWRATVDGQEATILRANVLFRAVALAAGERVVEFEYDPASLRLGLLLSAGSLGAALVLCIVWARLARPR